MCTELLADSGIPKRKQRQHLHHVYTSTQTVNTRLSIWWDKHHLGDKSLAFLEMFNWGETHSEHVQCQPMGGVSAWAEMWKGVRHQAPSLSASWLWVQQDQSPRALLQTRSWHNELYLQAMSQKKKCFLFKIAFERYLVIATRKG